MRGRLDERVSDELLSFWARHGFVGAPARERLGEVVCVLRDRGELAGASSVFKADVELIGWRRFFVYRNLLPGAAARHMTAMIRATFEALDAERSGDEADDEAVGLCLLLEAAARRDLPPEAEWRDPRFFYVGYLPDATQVRVAYFSDQFHDTTDTERALPPGYRVELFSEQEQVTREDVIEFWMREGVLSPEEAERRADEVLLVGTDPDRRTVGVATAYLGHNAQLRAQFWHYRTFVAATVRSGRVGLLLVLNGRDHLEQRFVSGEDPRGIGMLAEIEYEPLRRLLPKGMWRTVDLVLIGDNARGDHVRVHYFAGARAPEPG